MTTKHTVFGAVLGCVVTGAVFVMWTPTPTEPARLPRPLPGGPSAPPWLDHRLESRDWRARYSLLGELTGKDAVTKGALETLAQDEHPHVANQALVRYVGGFLEIDKSRIENHPEADILWRNVAKLISLKLKDATAKTSAQSRQLEDDTRILRAYTNEYALSRRLRSGSRYLTDHRLENAVIWFSDIVNFTRFVLRLSPERTADLVQRFFNAQAEAIQRHAGYIDKFMGDGLMAFWILSSEERVDSKAACDLALTAAEEAVQSVSRIRIGTEPLRLRVGLHLGPVLSGDFGSATRHQFTLIGAEVNKAARLEQLHEDEISSGSRDLGPIRLSAEFHGNLGGQIRQKYSRKSFANLKDIGQLTFYS